MIKTLSLQFFILVIILLFIIIGYSAYQKMKIELDQSEIGSDRYELLSEIARTNRICLQQAMKYGNRKQFDDCNEWLQRLEEYNSDNIINNVEWDDLCKKEGKYKYKKDLSIQLEEYKRVKTDD